MSKKKLLTMCVCALMVVTTFASCGNNSDSGVIPNGDITVVSREDGSGTRSAFVELLGIVDKEGYDATTLMAEVTNSTSVMLQTVMTNNKSIGYISLGSMSEVVKAISIDGVAPTAENIKAGTYKVARPFNIVTKTSGVDELTQDFIEFMLSKQGQEVVTEEGFIAEDNLPEYVKPVKKLKGTITISGSTSVAPVVEVMAERYKDIHKNVEIEIQQSGSSAGIQAAVEGVCQIGMVSRDVKDTELAQGLKSTRIALDGIVIVMNNEATIDDMSAETLRNIYNGKITKWEEVIK